MLYWGYQLNPGHWLQPSLVRTSYVSASPPTERAVKALFVGESEGSRDKGGLDCMQGFHHVYILQSEVEPECFYAGLTDDLQDRLNRHKGGNVTHTAAKRPWQIKTAIAFRNRERAAEFERYLKSASGRAFAKKRL